MARLIRASMVSLDGYYEDAEGSIDWSPPEPDLHEHANRAVGNLAGIVMGRRLYESMVPVWHDVLVTGEFFGEPAAATEREFAEAWDRLPKYVASCSLTEVHESCRLIEGDAIEAILELKRSTEGDIEVGGGLLADQLAALNEIDVYHLWILPVVVGGGKPFFPAGQARGDLELTDLRRFPRGSVALEYTARR